MPEAHPPTISVYPVGMLAALQRGRIRQEIGYLRRQFRARGWRAIRSSFNGYLAEVNYPGDLMHRTCGHGWTKRRAASSLGRYLVRDNPDRPR